MEYLKLSWNDIEEHCRVLAKEIEERAVPFDVIIGISRGGWVPARLLSDILGNDDVDTVRVKFYKSVGQTAKRPEILLSTQIDIEGKDVLLVDDIADTGESLIATVEHLKEKNVKNIFVATLVKKPQSKLTPDLFVRETPDWVIFPWEISETTRDIKTRSNSKEDLQKELKKAGLQQ
jgi:hypoxanthine phosphoribosyltransferase